MVSFVTDYIQNTAAGYLKTGITAAGTMAGNAVGGVGGIIESGGNSVAQVVAGGISGVGNYINSYGEGIKRTMGSDGPVSTVQQKKTAVKPGGGGVGQKALNSTGAPAKRLPAPPRTGIGGAKAAEQVAGSGTPKPAGAVGAAKPPQNKPVDNRTRISAASRPRPGGVNAKPAGAGVNSNTPKPPTPRPGTSGAKANPAPAAQGKISISPASRPKPGVRK